MERTEADPRSTGLLQEVQLGPKSSSPITRSHQRASADLRWSNTPRDKDVKTARKASAPVTSPMIRKQWVGNALSDLYFWQLASPTSRGYVVIWWQTSPASMISNCWVHEQQDDSFLFGYEAHSHPDENEEQRTNAWKLWLRQNISSHVQLLLQLRDMCKVLLCCVLQVGNFYRISHFYSLQQNKEMLLVQNMFRQYFQYRDWTLKLKRTTFGTYV